MDYRFGMRMGYSGPVTVKKIDIFVRDLHTSPADLVLASGINCCCRASQACDVVIALAVTTRERLLDSPVLISTT